MGRELYMIIKDPSGKTVWSSVELDNVQCEHDDVCFFGRNDATNVIAAWAAYGTRDLDVSDEHTFQEVVDDLNEVQQNDDQLYARLNDRVNALRECRSHAINLHAFNEFDDALGECLRDMEDVYWNRAADMIAYMKKVQQIAMNLALKADGFINKLDLNGYKIYWCDDE